jgi:hypothetical protein
MSKVFITPRKYAKGKTNSTKEITTCLRSLGMIWGDASRVATRAVFVSFRIDIVALTLLNLK